MATTSLLKSHLWVYWKVQRILFIVLFTMLGVNLAIQIGVVNLITGSFDQTTISLLSILSPVFGVFIGMLIAVPVTMVFAFPYLLTFNSRRWDIVVSASFNNFIYATFVALSLALLIGADANLSENLPPFYMGIIVNSWSDLLPIVGLNILMFFLITSIVLLIATVFFRWGIFWGLGTLLLLLTIPALSLGKFYSFFIWGGPYPLVYLFLLAAIALTISAIYRVLQRTDLRPSALKWQVKSLLFFVVATICFSGGLYLGIASINGVDTITVNDHGRFAYFEHGEIEREIDVTRENQELVLSWRSQIDTGELTFILRSPAGETVYIASGTASGIVAIPVAPGKWTYAIAFDDGYEGQYSLRAALRSR